MNVCYYQRKVEQWTQYDILARLVSGVAASASIVTFLKTNTVWGVDLTPWLAFLAAIISVGGASLRIPDKVRSLGVLLSEYTAHVHRFEQLYQFDCSDADLQTALKAFGETEAREAKDHPKPDDKLLEESRAAVMKRIGAAKPAAA